MARSSCVYPEGDHGVPGGEGGDQLAGGGGPREVDDDGVGGVRLVGGTGRRPVGRGGADVEAVGPQQVAERGPDVVVHGDDEDGLHAHAGSPAGTSSCVRRARTRTVAPVTA